MEIEICDRCYSKAQELHSCPYEEEINGDNAKLCNCCEGCTTDCRDSIKELICRF